MTQRGAGGGGAPQGYLSLMISVAGVVLSALAILMGANKTTQDETRNLERRLCWLETRAGKQECGK